MVWDCSPWALLPPFFSVFTAAGLWLVYFVALNEKIIEPLDSQYEPLYPPYIGNAGSSPPASCIFGVVVNLSAFMGFIIAVLRYRQLKHRIDKPWLNMSSLVAFSISCLGMILSANVQLKVNQRIHNFGSYLTFGLALVNCWIQTYMTLKVNLMKEGTKVGIIRFLLSATITVSTILYLYLMFQDLDRISARFHWALVMLLLVFISTFAIEFRHNRFYIECTENSGHPLKMLETLSEVSKSDLNHM